MTQASQPVRKRPSTATIILGAAGVIAVASAAVALTRDNEKVDAPAGAHGSAKPDQPVGDVNSMIASLEAKLKQNPDDAQGWRMLGWSYFETGDLMRSAGAYRRAAQIEPNNAENWSSLGEALQTASTDVSPEAKAAFERAMKIDAKDPRARYFLGVQKDLSGQHAAAIEDWIGLLKETPPGAPWESDLRRTILQVAEKSKIDVKGRMPAAQTAAAVQSVATAPIPGPTPEQLAAASSIPPSQQDEMVQGMVSRLADRLKSNPKDADGWIRLMRARMVLGEAAAASEALRSARAAFQGDAPTQGRLDRAATELGVPRGG
ncbi:MAG TPA: tetratricopeptide repeat protein [Allosphingosinicella sp.]|uniref:tetratricopeptide repeat protein n=1 Tax=Allosphingosinicella sp. TaxID=2823234 RepID=UPI002F273AB2